MGSIGGGLSSLSLRLGGVLLWKGVWNNRVSRVEDGFMGYELVLDAYDLFAGFDLTGFGACMAYGLDEWVYGGSYQCLYFTASFSAIYSVSFFLHRIENSKLAKVLGSSVLPSVLDSRVLL